VTGVGSDRRPRWLRAVLLLAVVGAIGLLALVIVTDAGRVGLFPGRTAAPGEAGWVRAAAAPIALTEVAAAAHQGRIWVAGGLDEGGGAVDRVLIYDPAADAWTDGPPLPEPVHHAALVSDGDALYLIGGYAGGGFDRPSASVWRLGDAGGWSADAALPQPRAAGAAAWNGRGQILFGGGVGVDVVSGDVFVREDDVWRLLTALSRPREHLAATSAGAGSVTFLGGRVGGLDSNLRTVDLVSAEGVVGRAGDLPTARGGIAAFSAGDLGDCVVGGEGPNGTFPDVECVGVTSTTTLPGLSVARHGLGAAVLDGRAYVLLGGRQPGLTVSDVVEVLDLR
jgi:Kelch motif